MSSTSRVPLTESSLRSHAFPSTLTLSGDTPVPSAPHSVDGDDDDDDDKTQIGSRSSSRERGLKGKLVDEEKAEQVELPSPQPTFDEGGARAYCAVLGATIIMAVTFGFSNSFGVLQSYLKTNQLSNCSPSAISWLGSTHLAITFSSSLWSGAIFDKGYFQYQLAFGSALWFLGTIALSYCREYYQFFLAYSICMGLALGTIFSPCLSCCGTYFLRKRSFVLGIAASGTALGAIIIPIMFENLIVKLSFTRTIQAISFLMLGLLILANTIMRPRVLPPKPAAPVLPLIAKIAKEPAAWLVCGGAFGVMIGLFIPLFYVVVFAKQAGVSTVLTKYALAIINAAAFMARIGAGLLADRAGSFNVCIASAVGLAAMVFAMLGATSTPGFIIFLILFGVCQGAFISTSASCFMALSSTPYEIGLRAGLGFLFVAAASLVGSPSAGALLQATGGGHYASPLCFGGACALLGSAGLVGARRELVRRKGTAWV